MRSKIWDRVEHKLQCMRRAMAETDPARQYLLTKVVDNYLNLNEAEQARYQAALAREKKIMVPFALTYEEALEEHKSRGLAEGQMQAMTEAILRLVDRRFGAASARLRDKLATVSDLGRLREIFDRAIEAPSLDQLEAAVT